MHDRHARTLDRVARLVRERLTPALYRASHPLEVSAWHAPGEPVAFAEAATAEYVPFAIGEAWGAPWSTTWFRISGEVPAAWRDESGALPAGTRPELVVDLGFTTGQPGFQAEGLVWTAAGVPVKGLAPKNQAVPIPANGRVDHFIEAAGNPDIGSDWLFTPTLLGDPETAPAASLYILSRIDIALLDRTVFDLLADVRVLTELVPQQPEGSPRRAQVLDALARMVDAVDPQDVAGSAAAARSVLAPALAKPAAASAHRLHAVGHAHIDSAWLWPLRETVRKCARTFSNALTLIDDEPDLTFAASSAQQYAWIEQTYPVLFERIRRGVAAGRFVPVGGMWVESDTNMPGGEALARQFITGAAYFRRAFGIESDEVWLPDSFGYSGALPQIARLAGMHRLLTQKISWNETNRFPHHTFQWEGIDGSRIFTHFPPADSYNSDLSLDVVAYAERNFADTARATASLLPFGYGDGGGGPTREMAAQAVRLCSLEGAPRVEHSTPARFFDEAQEEYPDAPVWVGELYLELHRGTYTSQHGTKQGNRRSEHLLREAELWAATAAVRADAPYPAAELERIWQLVLLHQFHDILPGSSIAWVHHDAERNHARIAADLEALVAASLAALGAVDGPPMLANAAPHARDGVPALGIGPAAAPEPVAVAAEGDGLVLDNGLIRAEFDTDGLLVSLSDATSGRDAVPPGTRGNLFQLHRDTPLQWDAWDVDREYRNVVDDLIAADSVTADGGVVRIVRVFGASRIEQALWLEAGSRELRMTVDVDWHELQKFLKLAFPLDVHAERFASEIQFGHIERATHTNTSWDAARFETSNHRWIRVAEPGFGVAITNDAVYGADVTRIARQGGGSATLARLSLLRAALFPDPQQDQGRHRFEFGVLPGASVTEAVEAGYRINLPRRITRGAPVAPLVRVDEPGVVVEAVKLAEDGGGDVVVRLYEALGTRTRARVVVDLPHRDVIETDLHERPLSGGALESADGEVVTLSLRAFQIVTLRIRRGD